MKNLSENIGIHGKINFHETITCKIIEQNEELCGILGKNRCRAISSLIKEGYEESYLREIISGPLDVDKIDYLLRDSYHCGVKYGIYDYYQLIKSIKAEPIDKYDRSLMIHEDGIRAFEQFLLAKYYIDSQVYMHKVRLITDSMIVRAIELGVEVDNIDFLKEIYIYKDSPEYLKEYLNWNDEKLTIRLLENYQNTNAGRIFSNLYNRKLLKRVFSQKINNFEEDIRLQIENMDTKEKAELEDKIAGNISENKNDVILKIISMGIFEKNKGLDLFVVKADKPVEIKYESKLYEILEKSERFIECYAPLEYKDNVDKKKMYKKHDKIIYNIISDYFKNKKGVANES